MIIVLMLTKVEACQLRTVAPLPYTVHSFSAVDTYATSSNNNISNNNIDADEGPSRLAACRRPFCHQVMRLSNTIHSVSACDPKGGACH